MHEANSYCKIALLTDIEQVLTERWMRCGWVWARDQTSSTSSRTCLLSHRIRMPLVMTVIFLLTMQSIQEIHTIWNTKQCFPHNEHIFMDTIGTGTLASSSSTQTRFLSKYFNKAPAARTWKEPKNMRGNIVGRDNERKRGGWNEESLHWERTRGRERERER